jgi:hypothetical protein
MQMTTRLKVYVSSTFGDLKEHRAAVLETIVRTGATPVAIENFGASTELPVEACREQIYVSDVMVLMVAFRYGAIPPGHSLSFTELEYTFAQQAGIPILVFLLDEDTPLLPSFVDTADALLRVKAFRRLLQERHLIEFFASPSDLALRVARALYRFVEQTGRDHEYLLQAASPKQARETQGENGDVLLRIEDHLESLRSTIGQLQVQVESAYRAKEGAPPDGGARVRPASFLGPMAKDVESMTCFVAMPYSKVWSQSLELTLMDICKSLDLKVLVAKNMDGRFIPHDIWQGITSAGVIVADLTDGNPNVAYEIGLADVLGKDVILLCQGDKVPFDFLGQRLICYEDTMKGAITLREELTAHLRQIINRTQKD